MQRIYFLSGVPFAGKSQFARNLQTTFGFEIVSVDTINERYGIGLNDTRVAQPQWHAAYATAREEMRTLLKSGKSVVFDAANANQKERKPFQDLARELGIQTLVIFFDIPPEVTKKRLTENHKTHKHHYVAEEDYESVKARLRPPGDEEESLIYRDENFNKWISSHASEFKS